MNVAVDLNAPSGVHVLACPGCTRPLRSTIGLTPVSLRCPDCGADFLARRSGLAEEGWVQIRVLALQEGDHYRLLGLAADADGAAIKAAYRRQALRWHPDRTGNSEAAVARFRAIAEAYAVLSDPQQRAAYDAESGRGSGDWRRWAAVLERSDVSGSPAGRRHGQQPWRPVVVRCLVIGLIGGVVVGLVLPRGTRPLQPLLGGVALVGLVRLALRGRQPAGR